MLIELKNKDTLEIGEFKFKCCIGKNGLKKRKIEGDKCTPTGLFTLGNLYFRKDRVNDCKTYLKKKIIKPTMGWCNNPQSKKYNSEIKIKEKNFSEKLYRKDFKYDYFIVINYNKKRAPYKGSAIFLHLTKNYKPTAGCVALIKKDFEILLKLINRKTKIKIG
jgi:L,D-peptidoglycan transpeptidase YkuD (ErfK/YbiS/YcfS/YnhG family)